MDVGLVCDVCDWFSAMGATACSSCGATLSLVPEDSEPSHLDPAEQTTGGVGSTAPPADTISCSSCGNQVPATHKFCGVCGAPMSSDAIPEPRVSAAMSGQAQPPHVTQPRSSGPGQARGGKVKTMFFSAIQATRAKLVLIKGDGLDGVTYTLAGDEHVAGREDAALLFEEDPYLSPIHANFFYRENKLVVRDEDSENGVFIRIRGSHPLQVEDRFLVGEQVLEVQATPSSDDQLEAEADGTYFFASRPKKSRFRLVQVLRGGDTGLAVHSDDGVVSLGREGNDINFPDDPFISGHHAQVSAAEGRLNLTDLGSKNGTFLRVNGESVLEHGDYVFMGQQLLRVEIV